MDVFFFFRDHNEKNVSSANDLISFSPSFYTFWNSIALNFQLFIFHLFGQQKKRRELGEWKHKKWWFMSVNWTCAQTFKKVFFFFIHSQINWLFSWNIPTADRYHTSGRESEWVIKTLLLLNFYFIALNFQIRKKNLFSHQHNFYDPLLHYQSAYIFIDVEIWIWR